MAQRRGNRFKQKYLLFSLHASLTGTSSCVYQYWTYMGTHGNLPCLNTAANVFIIKSPGRTTFIRRPSNRHYYSFKIFPRFWLVKTTRIIHHNQLLFTKFGKNLRHIESMTSKVKPAENYWTDDVKMTSKVQTAADYWTVQRENLRMRLCYFWEGNSETPLRTGKYFEWIIKQ